MAEYGQRERREGYGISPTLAEALYELAENHKIEIMYRKNAIQNVLLRSCRRREDRGQSLL
ncbi:hypothetical protein CGL52_07655 [Pyrobaculum aerophilum]|uniref:Uncharacterized protein n=2 Tax=Pyrobaculum aerophilum TaxID=13773 RepID=A0A371R379_9CREN|nr:hypothetical protein CGL52_07655 [Pyrobaculum aerophilum]